MQGMRMKSHKAIFVTSRPQKQNFQSNYGVSYGNPNNVLPFRRPGTSNPVVAEAKSVVAPAKKVMSAKPRAASKATTKKRTAKK